MNYQNYPTNYNPYPQYQRQFPQQVQYPQQNGIVWVNGEQEAAAYLVAPNCAVAMWDMNAPAVYLKQTDASGRPSFKAYDLVERSERPAEPQNVPMGDFITRAEFDALRAEIAEIRPKKKVKEDTTNE